MKKGISRNRHRSKCTCWRRIQRTHKSHDARNIHNHESEKRLQLAQKDFKWSRFAIIIQVVDFLIDKLPRLINYMMFLLGMG